MNNSDDSKLKLSKSFLIMHNHKKIINNLKFPSTHNSLTHYTFNNYNFNYLV
jgi:hypothetical protein